MKKSGVYTINPAGPGPIGQTFDNPTFDEERTGRGDANTTEQNSEFPTITNLRKFNEVPEDPGDVIKLAVMLLFILASFAIGVAITGANV